MSASRTNRKQKPIKIRAFMDGVDWLYELGSAADGTTLYPSAKCLKRETKHDLTDCGIAEVEVRLVRWVKRPKV